jgi:hypothetical protein
MRHVVSKRALLHTNEDVELACLWGYVMASGLTDTTYNTETALIPTRRSLPGVTRGGQLAPSRLRR